MKIILYKYSRENNLINKGPHLTGSLILNGVILKERTSILKPVLLISNLGNDGNEQITYNYLYIQSLNRYYFIDDIVQENNKLWSLYCSIDVLYTYRSAILNLKVLLNRSTNYGSRLIVDNVDSWTNKPQQFIVTPSTSSSSLINTTFNVTNINNKHVVINVINDKIQTFTSSSSYAISGVTCLPHVEVRADGQRFFNYKYITAANLNNYIKLAISTEQTFIKSAIIFPFEFEVQTAEDPETHISYPISEAIRVGDTTFSDLAGYLPTKSNPGYLVIADFVYNITGNDWYGNYEPYTKYELWIPYVGWKEISSYELLNKRILVAYTVDTINGSGTAYIINKTNDYIIAEYSCQLGVKVGISRENLEEIENQMNGQAIKSVITGIGSAALALVGGITGHAGLIAGGVVGLANSITNLGVAAGTMHPTGSTEFTGNMSGAFNKQDVVIRITKLPRTDTSNNKVNEIGLPADNIVLVSSCSGFLSAKEVHVGEATLLNSATKIEKDEISKLLKEGVFISE